MKQLNAEFVKSTEKVEQFPRLNLPETAFVGRSNVGKSSLLNSIVLRKNLAHISSTPGKTQQINFFIVENKWTFADLPGFGYAKVSKDKRDVFVKMNFAYLEKREELKIVCVLIDSRHDPMETDMALIEWLENHQRNYVIILTKSDKIKPSQLLKRKEQLQNLVSQCSFCTDVVAYSVINFTGRNELIGILKKYLIFD